MGFLQFKTLLPPSGHASYINKFLFTIVCLLKWPESTKPRLTGLLRVHHLTAHRVYLVLGDDGHPHLVDHVGPACFQQNCCIHHTNLFTCRRSRECSCFPDMLITGRNICVRVTLLSGLTDSVLHQKCNLRPDNVCEGSQTFLKNSSFATCLSHIPAQRHIGLVMLIAVPGFQTLSFLMHVC